MRSAPGRGGRVLAIRQSSRMKNAVLMLAFVRGQSIRVTRSELMDCRGGVEVCDHQRYVPRQSLIHLVEGSTSSKALVTASMPSRHQGMRTSSSQRPALFQHQRRRRKLSFSSITRRPDVRSVYLAKPIVQARENLFHHLDDSARFLSRCIVQPLGSSAQHSTRRSEASRASRAVRLFSSPTASRRRRHRTETPASQHSSMGRAIA